MSKIDLIWKFIEERWRHFVLVLAALVIVLFLILIGSAALKDKDTAPVDFYEELLEEELVEVDTETTSNGEAVVTAEVAVQEIIVDVKGAVAHPGVYKLPPNSRIIDAIDMAGGTVSTAEEKSVNFALKLEDQMVIYVPEVGEETEINLATYTPQGTSKEDLNSIDINHADKDTLMQLNGIGASKADSIIQYREENGLFKSIDEIKNVSGIGDATFEKLKDVIKATSN